jgi:hypothetical protein
MPTGTTGVQGIQGLQGAVGVRGATGLPGWAHQPTINQYGNNPTGPAGSFGGIKSIITSSSVPTTTNPGALTIITNNPGGGSITYPVSYSGFGCFYYNQTASGITFVDTGGYTIGTIPSGRLALITEAASTNGQLGNNTAYSYTRMSLF